MTEPATLGRGLGRSFALATLAGMLLYGAITFSVYYFTEVGERCEAVGQIEDPPGEILAQTALAFAFAAPIGIVLSVLLGRRLTRGTRQRLDAIIATTRRMTGERLDLRLPVTSQADALDRVAHAFNSLLERIESGVAAQRQFAADASHELRTPLAVISTNLEVARRKAREPSHWEHVADDALTEVRRMNSLVDKLLTLSRAGAAGLTHERGDLRGLAAIAVERAGQRASEREVKLELAPGPAVEAEIDADAMAIVLDNLLRNAIDHSPAGETVVVRIEQGPRIAVDDRGPGIPVEQRTRIFEAFARGAQGAADRSGGDGFGLGLAICKRIVAGHHGSIAVEDRSGGGTRFLVTLPAT